MLSVQTYRLCARSIPRRSFLKQSGWNEAAGRFGGKVLRFAQDDRREDDALHPTPNTYLTAVNRLHWWYVPRAVVTVSWYA